MWYVNNSLNSREVIYEQERRTMINVMCHRNQYLILELYCSHDSDRGYTYHLRAPLAKY